MFLKEVFYMLTKAAFIQLNKNKFQLKTEFNMFSVSYHPSKNILIYWFGALKHFQHYKTVFFLENYTFF